MVEMGSVRWRDTLSAVVELEGSKRAAVWVESYDNIIIMWRQETQLVNDIYV